MDKLTSTPAAKRKFFEAIREDNVAAIRDMLAQGASVSKRIYRKTNNEAFGPALYAVKCGSGAALAILLEAGADLREVSTTTKRNALMYAAANGDAAMLMRLLALGFDARQVDASGATALMHAAKQGKAATVSALLARSDIDAQDREGNTALHHAASGLRKNRTAMRVLVEAGAALDIKNSRGQTALERYEVALDIKNRRARDPQDAQEDYWAGLDTKKSTASECGALARDMLIWSAAERDTKRAMGQRRMRL
ncbi:ankyrin repeat domain-containing protein [Pseudomarimonas arenosa]|uniref:Ankyrin repeat domain-containing protein n=1 Tax=Pseudomarimonas arenosa TaxID=2774145 RepID=A0AAW3ZQT3_9GAMM|nr:ankyrin repeat domain-containing protein [Pseudomarimonas arenosa]MBD8527275.1 ankyrin repeat domain-containing protein [Pseudomarimonas arenosa]